MSLYALDDDLLVYAPEAAEQRIYRCSGCRGAVRVRKGRFRVAHFYHVNRSPSCRLYSKSEDHLLAQLALQEWLPRGEVVLEKPFPEILRVADVVWEPRRLVFEIQCSQLSIPEVEKRTGEYRELGYQVVWLLDDRLFNRPYVLRPAEKALRQHPCYYATLRSAPLPRVYDQFEVLHQTQRLQRGARATVHLDQPRELAQLSWDARHFSDQVLQRTAAGRLYFQGDLLHKALLAAAIPQLASTMRNFRALETLLIASAPQLESPFKRWLIRHVLAPLGRFMLYLHERAAR